jgi:hypothetical protein
MEAITARRMILQPKSTIPSLGSESNGPTLTVLSQAQLRPTPTF